MEVRLSSICRWQAGVFFLNRSFQVCIRHLVAVGDMKFCFTVDILYHMKNNKVICIFKVYEQYPYLNDSQHKITFETSKSSSSIVELQLKDWQV